MKHTDYTNRMLHDRYFVVRLLGEGGMGAVYLAQHSVIGKKVAVKFLHSEFSDNKEVVKRFYREAQAAAAIEHKNIIDIFDVGASAEGEPFLVMEYLEGESLSSMLKRTGPISLPAACAVLEPVLSALSAAHAAGIIHRDLKPDNIFIAHNVSGDTEIKLIDFGISKITTGDQSGITGTGMFLGTPAYTSPEQIRGAKNIDHRTDIYAIGTILYQMLTGKLPFKGEHVNSLLASVLEDEPIPPKEAFEGFPGEAEDLIRRLLSKDPDERPRTTEMLFSELKRLGEFDDRQSQLKTYTSGLKKKSFAGGDLGSPVGGESGKVASDVLASISGKVTPTAWAAETVNVNSSKKGPTSKLAIAGIAALFALVVVGVLTAISWTQIVGTEPAVPLTQPSLSKNSESDKSTIQINLTGVPKEASLFLDGALVPRTSFPLPVGSGYRTLKMTAPGYEELLLGIFADKDQTIPVKMKPLKIEDASGALSNETVHLSQTPSTKEKVDNSKSKKSLTLKPAITNAGLTKMSERFDD